MIFAKKKTKYKSKFHPKLRIIKHKSIASQTNLNDLFIGFLTSDLVFTDANDTLFRYFRLTKTQIIGKTFLDVFFPDQTNISIIRTLLNQLKKEKPINTEVYINSIYNEKLIIDFRFQPIKNNELQKLYFAVIGSIIFERRKDTPPNKNQRQLLKTILNTIPDLVFFKDSHSVYLGCNPAFAQFIGFAEAEIRGKTDKDFFSPEICALREKAESFVSYENTSFTLEESLKKANNESHHFETILAPLISEDSSFSGIMGISRDITERKKSQEIIMRSEKKYRLLFENMSSGFALLQIVNNSFGSPVDFILLETNFVFDTLVRIDKRNVLLKSVYQMYPDLEKGWLQMFSEVCRSGNSIATDVFVSILDKWLSIKAFKSDENQFAILVDDISQEKEKEKQIWKQANYDPLTELPNRRLFRDQLAHEISLLKTGMLAVFFIDLDHFKNINDMYGHNVGDKVLIETGKRIISCVRKIDTVARLGGDEFTVLIPNLIDTERVDAVAKSIIQKLSKVFIINGIEIKTSGSIGVSLLPNDSTDADSIINHADHAMYEAKIAGRSQFKYYIKH